MNIYDELKMKVFQSGSRVNFFIGINVIVFLVISLASVFEYLFTKQTSLNILVTEYLAVPTYLPKLLSRFWTPLTYMFLHAGFFHILFNMLWLFWMGRIFEEYLNSKKLTFVYLAGGLAGAVFYILCYNIFPAFADDNLVSSAVGASAAVTAIVIATATLLPDYTIFLMIFGAVRLKWIALIYIVIDLISIAGPNAGGHLTHLGGAIFGFLFIKSLQNGNDWSKPFENLFKSRPKLKVVSKNYSADRKASKNSVPDQEVIDKILDKISESGYNNLSKKEKEILFNASKNNEEK
ncbi:rhomboid family intramembrane serine protease [Pelobium sp.]|nr:rhomboid family intramembrane serine protease [Pelobium sp.]MDA9555006.1 rhomboid family intramembrane serine protease [Pelobium sp.]